MDIEARKRRMDKIHKCLRLSASSNPNEAAAALRQAQKMMEAWKISEDDLAGAGYGKEEVDLPVQVNKKTCPLQILILNALIKKAFGVRCIISYSKRQSDYSYQIKIFGPDQRIPMAAYAATVVYRACNSAWAKYLKENPYLKGSRGSRATFMAEWISAVADTVTECGFTDEEQVGTDLALKAEYGERELRTIKNSKIGYDPDAGRAGRESASQFHLNRPMDTNRNKLESF